VDLEIESQPLAADQTVHDGRRHARPSPTLLMLDEAGRLQQPYSALPTASAPGRPRRTVQRANAYRAVTQSTSRRSTLRAWKMPPPLRLARSRPAAKNPHSPTPPQRASLFAFDSVGSREIRGCWPTWHRCRDVVRVREGSGPARRPEHG
jgi:hypothetical protein